VRAYKFLAAGAVGRFSDVAWPPAGTWLEADGPPERCRSGIHACLPPVLLDWLDDELWEVELAGAVEHDGEVVAERGRLVARVGGWDEDAARGFADVCVGRARAGAVAALRSAGLGGDADALARAEGFASV
jgi:hypothetical protein